MAGGPPPTRWGWHELSPAWAERLVADSGIRPGDLVLDIGAGRGAVTVPLLAAGARVVAVELHPDRARALAERFAGDRRVVVVRADARDLRLPRSPFCVVASVPYAVTSPLLRRLTHPGSRMTAAHLLVQAQAATRWASPSAPAGARWQRTFSASLGAPVPRRAFSPPPRVDSRVLVLRRRRPPRRGRGGT